MEECNHDCSACSEKCENEKTDFRIPANSNSNIKKVYAVVSGKGGVGKSLVTSLLACSVSSLGKKVAVMDADVTGPSIPKAFGLHEKAESNDLGLIPSVSKNGIEIMSINLLLETETTPVVWRGPVISGVIQQFWTDVFWGDIDYMFIDMPPGTGDVPLTVYQSLPIDGIIIVTTPQDLVSMIVSKAYNMAKLMNIPIVGIVENMSYVKCPDCRKEIKIFGESKADEISKELGTEVLARMPIDPITAEKVDSGNVESASFEELSKVTDKIVAD